MPSTVLFGIDVFVLVFGLFRLIADRLNLSEDVRLWVRSILLTACVAVVLLQGMGLILGPGSEPWVQFVATLLAVFLGSMGYGNDLASMLGAARALGDTIKMRALIAMSKVLTQDEETAKKLMGRYRIYG